MQPSTARNFLNEVRNKLKPSEPPRNQLYEDEAAMPTTKPTPVAVCGHHGEPLASYGPRMPAR